MDRLRFVLAFFIFTVFVMSANAEKIDQLSKVVSETESKKLEIAKRLKDNKKAYDELSKELAKERQNMTKNVLTLYRLMVLKRLLEAQNLVANKAFWNAELLISSSIQESLRRQFAYSHQMEALSRLDAVLERNLKELLGAEGEFRKNLRKLLEKSQSRLSRESIKAQELPLPEFLDSESSSSTGDSKETYKNLPLPVDGKIESSVRLRKEISDLPIVYSKGVFIKAKEGEKVRAVADGKVSFAGWFREFGRTVIIDHGNHYFSVVTYLGSIRVSQGDVVRKGDVIGDVGKFELLDESGIYFEWRHKGKPVDIREWFALKNY